MRPNAIRTILPAVAALLGASPAAPAFAQTRGCHRSVDASPAPRGRPKGQLVDRGSGLVGRPFGIRVSARGVVLVTQQDANSVARLRLDDIGTPAGPAIRVGADPGDVVVSRDGTRAFVSNFNDGTVQVLDVRRGTRVALLPLGTGNAYRLALSPDEERLYVTSTNGSLYAVDLTERDSITSVRLGGALQGLAMGRDGGTLIVSGSDGRVWRVDACSLAVDASTRLQASATQEAMLAPDETEIYVADEEGFVDVLDATTLQRRRRLSLPGLRPFGAAVTPDGTQLYIASAGTGHVAIVDSRSGDVVKLHRVGGRPRRIAFDVAGSTAVVSNEGNWVDVIR